MNNAYLLGFVKRAQEFGLNEHQAIELAKQAMPSLEELKSGLGGLVDKAKGGFEGLANNFRNSELNTKHLLPARHALEAQLANLDPQTKAMLLGAGGGALLGGVGGAMVPSEDAETGETHRLRNALIGGLAGAGIGGAGARYGAPAAESALPAIKAQLEKMRGAIKG